MTIPRQIFQTWKTKAIPARMEKAMQTIRSLNPDWKYRLFDDRECRQYLTQHFSPNVVRAFDTVIPGAFKADIWRYAVLWREGGVYLDADFEEYIPLSDILLPEDQLVSVKDRDCAGQSAVFQAFIATVPGHPVLRRALDLSVENVLGKKMGVSPLDITGPIAFGRAVNSVRGAPGLPLQLGTTQLDANWNIRLLIHHPTDSLVLDVEDGKKLFHTKFQGYTPITDYGNTVKYFLNTSPVSKKKTVNWTWMVITMTLVVVVVTLVLSRIKR